MNRLINIIAFLAVLIAPFSSVFGATANVPMNRFRTTIFALLIGLFGGNLSASDFDPKMCANALRSFVDKFDPWAEDMNEALGVNKDTFFERAEFQHEIAVQMFQEKLENKELDPKLKRSFEEAVANLDKAWVEWKKYYGDAKEVPQFSAQNESDGEYKENAEVGEKERLIDAFDYTYWRNFREEFEKSDSWKDDGSPDNLKLAPLADALHLVTLVKIDPKTGKESHILIVSENAESKRSIGQQALTIEAGKEILKRSKESIASYPLSTKAGYRNEEAFVLINFLRDQNFPFVGFQPKNMRASKKKNKQAHDSISGKVDFLDFAVRLIPLSMFFIPPQFGADIYETIFCVGVACAIAHFAFPTRHHTEGLTREYFEKGSVIDRYLTHSQNRKLLKAIKKTIKEKTYTKKDPLVIFVGEQNGNDLVTKLMKQGWL